MKIDQLVKMFAGADGHRNDLEVSLDDIRSWHAERERLLAVEKAARTYYLGYCQDEADEEGVCDLAQQLAAQTLRDALRDYGSGQRT